MKTQIAVGGFVILLLVGVGVGYVVAPRAAVNFADLSVEEQRAEWMSEADIIKGRADVTYRCCQEDPCWYCIQKSPGHGEGADCTCEDDILAHENPCGECIGEVLEGHGLVTLQDHYAAAFAEKIGEISASGDNHQAHLENIINDIKWKFT